MVKEKPNSVRLYDEDGYRRRAACICVRSIEEAEVIYLIITEVPFFIWCQNKNFSCDKVFATIHVLKLISILSGFIERRVPVFYY